MSGVNPMVQEQASVLQQSPPDVINPWRGVNTKDSNVLFKKQEFWLTLGSPLLVLGEPRTSNDEPWQGQFVLKARVNVD
jgi:hypothetical protein